MYHKAATHTGKLLFSSPGINPEAPIKELAKEIISAGGSFHDLNTGNVDYGVAGLIENLDDRCPSALTIGLLGKGRGPLQQTEGGKKSHEFGGSGSIG